MASINTSSSSSPNFPINSNHVKNVKNVQNVAQDQVQQQLENAGEVGDSLAKKLFDFALTMQFMDQESSERL